MSPSKTPIPTTDGEHRAIEFTSRSINGHSRIPLTPPYPYSDRFLSRDLSDGSTETTPVTSLTPALALPHLSRDTVIYTLPLTGGATRNFLFKKLWKAWYPLRPMKLRNFDDEGGKKSTKSIWAGGERFFGLTVSVRDLPPEPDARGTVGVDGETVSVKAIELMAEFHGLLANRIGELGEEVREKYGRRGADGVLGNAFARAFVVLDRFVEEEEEEAGELVMLLVIRSDAVEQLRRDDRLAADEAVRKLLSEDENKVAEFEAGADAHQRQEGPGRWQIRRLRIEDIVRVVAALDDPDRLQDDASISEDYVKRFGGGETK